MQAFPSKEGSVHNYSATSQHFNATEAPVVDASKQLSFAVPKQLSIVVPMEGSRDSRPKTPEVHMPSSPKLPPAVMPKVQVDSSTKPQQAVKVWEITFIEVTS